MENERLMATRLASPVFIGRRHELAQATAALERARDGQPSVLLVAGEAGVGKTRFVSEASARAEGQGFRILAGGCIQLGDEGLPFAALIAALRGLGRKLGPARLEGLAGTGRAELARLLPDLVDETDSSPASFGVVDTTAQGRLFEHLLRFLARLAEQAPLLLVLEDLQWADRSTLELLDFLVRNLADARIVLIATYRSDDLHRRHPLVAVLAELERTGRVERLELARFDRVELAAQLGGILGAPPDDDLVDVVLRRSDGNAFYAEELLAAAPASSQLPATLRDVLLARVAQLSAPTQELLQAAAATGPSVSPALLERTLTFTRASIMTALREAIAAHVLVPEERPGFKESYRFRHALVQEAIEAELLPGERAHLHATFASALADEGTEPTPARAAEIAYHWQAAHDLPRAFDAWLVAGTAAESVFAFAEAGAHFEHALELWDLVPDAQRSGLDRVELLVRAATDRQTSAPRRSVALVRRAIGLVDPVAEATRAGLLHEQLGEFLDLSIDPDGAAEAYAEAVRLVPADPPSPARARVLGSLCHSYFYQARYRDGAAAGLDAVAMAHAFDAQEEESRALIWLSAHEALLGDAATSHAHARASIELAARIGDAFNVARALTIWSGEFLICGEWAAAIEAGREAEAFVLEHGFFARFGTTILAHIAGGLLELGHWGAADDVLARAGVFLLRDTDLDEHLVLLASRRGRFADAVDAAERLRILEPRLPSLYIVPGLVELAMHQAELLEARRMIAERLSAYDRQPYLPVILAGWTLTLGLRAEADLAARARAGGSLPNLAEASLAGAGLLARVRALHDEVARERPYFEPIAAAYLAQADGEYGRLTGAPDPASWAASASAWEALPIRYDAAYCRFREGEAALQGSGDRKRAVAALTLAREGAAALGATPLLALIDDVLLRADIRSSPTTAGAARGLVEPLSVGRARANPELTSRERDVLRLLASGSSDGEIAAALFITKKTASTHVANIKSKLGARSRVEIATTAIGLGLADPPVPGHAS
jgi:DNA-binding CsgD family transcriptional regulator